MSTDELRDAAIKFAGSELADDEAGFLVCLFVKSGGELTLYALMSSHTETTPDTEKEAALMRMGRGLQLKALELFGKKPKPE